MRWSTRGADRYRLWHHATCSCCIPGRGGHRPGRRADTPRPRRLMDRRRDPAACAQRCVGRWATPDWHGDARFQKGRTRWSRAALQA